ncbi:hypothetical protein [Chitinophaga sp. OAE865]|uniref:hypothetical protein n=1 Tax=Chitinophaga sp. OAE865 TaxID=2817898 RepID=UPI001AE4C7FF
MTQQPFTQSGVQLKQQELYALTDALLLAEAKSMTTNFRAWLDLNFSFTADQKSYLDTAPAQVLAYWAGLISSTVITRGPIDIPKPQKYDPPRRTKEFTLEIFGKGTFIPYPNSAPTFTSDQSINITFKVIDLP